MTDPELQRDAVLAKSAPWSKTREDWYKTIRLHAERTCKAGRSIQGAVSDFITKDPCGRAMHKAMNAAGGIGEMAKKLPAGDDEAGLSLDELCADTMAKTAGLTKARAMAAVLKSPQGARAYGRERDARLTKALGGA